jgi:guanine deaminase
MLLRAAILTPSRAGQIVYQADGAILIRDGRIAACGAYAEISAAHPEAAVRDLRGGYLLPGFVDAHVHFPQVRVIGGLGMELLDWLERRALPEEVRFSDAAHAAHTARVFVQELLRHGTTCAMVFGAHFAGATAALFDAAAEAGPRMTAGLVLSDRGLRPELLRTPEAAYRESADLIRRYHGRGRLRYAVTPRFALSASEAMLEVCQTLRREFPGVLVQTHLNENRGEIDEVATFSPGRRTTSASMSGSDSAKTR